TVEQGRVPLRFAADTAAPAAGGVSRNSVIFLRSNSLHSDSGKERCTSVCQPARFNRAAATRASPPLFPLPEKTRQYPGHGKNCCTACAIPAPAWFIRASAETPRANAAFSASCICAEVTTGKFTVPRSLLSFSQCWRIFYWSKFCDGDVSCSIRARNADREKAANRHRRVMIDWCKKCEGRGRDG